MATCFSVCWYIYIYYIYKAFVQPYVKKWLTVSLGGFWQSIWLYDSNRLLEGSAKPRSPCAFDIWKTRVTTTPFWHLGLDLSEDIFKFQSTDFNVYLQWKPETLVPPSSQLKHLCMLSATVKVPALFPCHCGHCNPPNTIKIYCDTRTIFKYLVAQSHLFLNSPLCAACFQQGCAVIIPPKSGFQIIISMIGSKPSLRLIVLLQWCSKLSKYVHVSRYGFYIHVAPVQPHQLLPSSDTHLLTQHCALRSTSLQVMGSLTLFLSLSIMRWHFNLQTRWSRMCATQSNTPPYHQIRQAQALAMRSPSTKGK